MPHKLNPELEERMKRLNHLAGPWVEEFKEEEVLAEWRSVEALFQLEQDLPYSTVQWILGLGMSAFIKLERFDEAMDVINRIRSHPGFLKCSPFEFDLMNGEFGWLLIKVGRVEEGLEEWLSIASHLETDGRSLALLICRCLIHLLEEGALDPRSDTIKQIANHLTVYAGKGWRRKLPELGKLLIAIKVDAGS